MIISATEWKNMMNMKRVMMSLIISAAVLSVSADTFTTNGVTWTYTVVNGEASLGGGSSSSTAVPTSTTGTLEIPEMLADYAVTRIGPAAFYGCRGLTNSIGGVAMGGARPVAPEGADAPSWTAWQYNWKVEPWKTLGKSFDKTTLTYAILADGAFSEDEAV